MFSITSLQVTTSYVVGLVANEGVSLTAAFPIIVGANVGTSVTNTTASLVLYRERRPLRRAFCVAAMHDIFNILTAILVLSLEYISGGLMEKLTLVFVGNSRSPPVVNLYKLKSLSFNAITEPVVDTVVQLKGTLIETNLPSLLKDCKEEQDCSYIFQNW